MLALVECRPEAFRTLLEMGADVHGTDGNGDTAYDIARERADRAAMSLLIAKCPDLGRKRVEWRRLVKNQILREAELVFPDQAEVVEIRVHPTAAHPKRDHEAEEAFIQRIEGEAEFENLEFSAVIMLEDLRVARGQVVFARHPNYAQLAHHAHIHGSAFVGFFWPRCPGCKSAPLLWRHPWKFIP